MKEKVSYQFSGEMRRPWLPLAKHEISMRSFKAGDVLRRQMLYRLSTDGFQETLSFILLVQCQKKGRFVQSLTFLKRFVSMCL